MHISEFDFTLPEELIALRPVSPRSASKLLHVGNNISDKMFSDLPDLLEDGDILVINNTRVIPAALRGYRQTRDEAQNASHVYADINLHKNLETEDNKQACWKAFIRPGKRFVEGDRIFFEDGLEALVLDKQDAEVTLGFNRNTGDFNKLLDKSGIIPLPPYIGKQRQVDEQDKQDYQTVYAKEKGSVAAPTAGLHFTDSIFERLKAAGVSVAEVTLHVGAGTFLPVSVDNTEDHQMHAEWGEISPQAARLINEKKNAGGKVVCVGTTSLRLLESATDEAGQLKPFSDETDIFISPGYQFKIVDRLITNFHLPKSTLFMLVSAFTGLDKMRQAYEHAIAKKYRFYSYGDACLLDRQ